MWDWGGDGCSCTFEFAKCNHLLGHPQKQTSLMSCCWCFNTATLAVCCRKQLGFVSSCRRHILHSSLLYTSNKHTVVMS